MPDPLLSHFPAPSLLSNESLPSSNGIQARCYPHREQKRSSEVKQPPRTHESEALRTNTGAPSPSLSSLQDPGAAGSVLSAPWAAQIPSAHTAVSNGWRGGWEVGCLSSLFWQTLGNGNAVAC